MDSNGTYEIGITYSFFETPTFFKLLDCNGNQIWNLKFDEGIFGPEIVDIDNDGEKELIFELDFENLRPKCDDDFSLEELLEKLRNIDFEETNETKEYLYIFNAKGEIERQFEVPFRAARQDFCDLDGDGDLDALYYTSFGKEVFYCFTNTMYRGELDTLQAEGHF